MKVEARIVRLRRKRGVRGAQFQEGGDVRQVCLGGSSLVNRSLNNFNNESRMRGVPVELTKESFLSDGEACWSRLLDEAVSSTVEEVRDNSAMLQRVIT